MYSLNSSGKSFSSLWCVSTKAAIEKFPLGNCWSKNASLIGVESALALMPALFQQITLEDAPVMLDGFGSKTVFLQPFDDSG